MYPHALISIDLSPSLTLDLAIRGVVSAVVSIDIRLQTDSGRIAKQETVDASQLALKPDIHREVIQWSLEKDEVQLWWPTGYGAQQLYEVDVTLLDENNSVLDRQKKKFGFRRVRLLQEPLNEADKYGKGTSFLFEVNNVRMFIGGSKWVPGDVFLTTVTPERYRSWLQLMKSGNQNMVRLWGGGVYEPDAFYEICDELGIPVWQDFQFACGIYPAHDEFVANVRREAERIIYGGSATILVWHSSVETMKCVPLANSDVKVDYQQVLQWDVETDFPARKIYEEVLPEVVTCLTRDEIPYHRGSPYGGEGWDTADPTVGDVYQWNIWAGVRVYQDYDLLGGRFVSEFGMPSVRIAYE